MVSKWNYFIFMQIDYPRWPPGTVTKNSINTKMTISQDPLVEIDPAFCQNVSCINLLYFLQFWIPRWLLLLKIAQNMKIISQ